MATAIQEAMASRAHVAVPAAPPRLTSGDTAIVSELPAGVLVVRQGGIVSRMNPAAGRLLHLEAGTALPARSTELLARHPSLLQAVEQALSSKSVVSSRLEVSGVDGTKRALALCVWPMQPEAGAPASVLVLLTDLTDAERGLTIEHQRDSMARVATLTSALAHELANSLTGIHGFSRMIDPASLSEADRTTLEALQRETDTLGEAIEGFRRVTRPLALIRERFPVRWLVEDSIRHVVAELQMAADAVSAKLPDGLEIDGDRILLEEALMNVLRNALEAASDAGIRADVRVAAFESARGAAVTISVEDNGPGVSEEDRPHLFEPFFTTRAKHQGLGLARTRHIVQSHDGTVGASATPGGGLVVTLTIPFPETAPAINATH
jgi:signal transduction histidine kinase